MANHSYFNLDDELKDQKPYQSIANGEPLVDVNPSSSDLVKQAIMNKMGTAADGADDSLEDDTSEPEAASPVNPVKQAIMSKGALPQTSMPAANPLDKEPIMEMFNQE